MPNNSAKVIWERALELLKAEVSPASYETWLESTKGISLTDRLFTLEVSNSFIADWLEQRMKALLERTLAMVLHEPINISITISKYNSPQEHSTITTNTEEHKKEIKSGYLRQIPKKDLTFNSFISTDHSELARAAAIEVIEKPGHTYNPLVLSGPPGVGKTHLLHAMAHEAKERNNRTLLTTAEHFVNEFIDAARHKGINQFREFYRSPDIFILDDVQFICGKEKSEENLYYTFNTLLDKGKQVVLSSQIPLEDLVFSNLQLQNSLSSGLNITLDVLNKSSLVSILAFKATRLPIQLPDDILHYLANRPYKNMHQLDGDLNKIVALGTLTGRPLDLDLAIHTLSPRVNSTISPKSMQASSFIKGTAAYYQFDVSVLIGKTRHRNVVQARHIAMYLIRENTILSLSQIGKLFGGRDHTSVLHGIQKIKSRLSTDETIATEIASISHIVSTTINNI